MTKMHVLAFVEGTGFGLLAASLWLGSFDAILIGVTMIVLSTMAEMHERYL